MVAPNRRNGGVQLLLILAAAISLTLAAPSFKELNKFRQKQKNKILSTTTTTPAPHTNATSCEEKYRNGGKSSFDETSLNTDIKRLMESYHNWGELLAQAPVAITTLGKLIIMSNQKLDFPIDESLPTDGFKHIKYPKSFRTTLLQISHSGYLAFLKAHTNMDKIRMYNSNVPSHIKDITRYLMSKKEILIVNLLPISLGYIKKAADQSKELSKEVKKEFQLVVELIQETIQAVTYTKGGKEIKLSEVVFDIDVSKISHDFSQNETKLLQEKKETLSRMLLNFDYRQKNILVRTIYGNEDFVINLSKKEWLSQTGGRHEKHYQVFYGKNNWIHNYTDERVEADLCLEQNNQHLLELIINMGQYRLRYELWQKSSSKEKFDGTEDLVKLETGLKDLKYCSTVHVIVTKFAALIKQLQNVKFNTLKKNSARPAEKEMNELILIMNKIRSETNLKTKEERKSTTDGYTNLNLMEVWRKNHLRQLEMLNSMIMTTEEIVKINNQQLELRRRKTEQVLDKLKSLDITKTNLTETIQALQEGLVELVHLKGVWSKLMDFYSRMSTFMDAAALESMGLIEYLSVPMKTSIINDEDMFLFFLEKMEKANEASFLVHQISDMYVNVSDAYIMTRMASLDKMVDPLEIHNLTQYQQDLIATTKNDTENILKYITADEKSLKKELVGRHNQIMDEYQWTLYCWSSEDEE